MNKTPCFSPAHILLPSEQIPVGQWGCGLRSVHQ